MINHTNISTASHSSTAKHNFSISRISDFRSEPSRENLNNREGHNQIAHLYSNIVGKDLETSRMKEKDFEEVAKLFKPMDGRKVTI